MEGGCPNMLRVASSSLKGSHYVDFINFGLGLGLDKGLFTLIPVY